VVPHVSEFIRYDTRGHGGSEVPPGDYTVDDLGRDALAVLDAAGAATALVCGISLGGLTAMWLGVNAPDRVTALVAANTAARIGTVERWTERIAKVRNEGNDGRRRHDDGHVVYRRLPPTRARRRRGISSDARRIAA
jgi:pimeloyl-ACP methyl ester carboxylesterase